MYSEDTWIAFPLHGRIGLGALWTSMMEPKMANPPAFILAKNEEANIERCIAALLDCDFDVTVLDSGSTDDTLAISEKHRVHVEPYGYKNHCSAYNEITSKLPRDQWCLVLDADMVLSRGLAKQIAELILDHQAVRAPVRMIYGGHELRFASLYPPKPIAFQGGREYFEPRGHGEALKEAVRVGQTSEKLVHDDRKPFSHYMNNQLRYADELILRSRMGAMSYKDRIRLASPFGVFLVPLIILFVRGGILDGRAGALYAMDRMIVEALKYRRSLFERLSQHS